MKNSMSYRATWQFQICLYWAHDKSLFKLVCVNIASCLVKGKYTFKSNLSVILILLIKYSNSCGIQWNRNKWEIFEDETKASIEQWSCKACLVFVFFLIFEHVDFYNSKSLYNVISLVL